MKKQLTREESAIKITWIGFFVNLGLMLFKLTSGILGHSAAMIADAIHSFSDFAAAVVVIISMKFVRQPEDEDHQYGHGKFETLATAFIGITLMIVGLGIFYTGSLNIIKVIKGERLEAPGTIALIAALVSIISKEILYRVTISIGKKIESQAVIASAWDHRSDAFSSIGTAVGIGGALFLGPKFHIMDPLAGILVSILICKVGFTITRDSTNELLEKSLSNEEKTTIISLIESVKGISDPHDLKTRKIGNSIAVDVHVRLNGALTVTEGHNLTSEVEKKVREKFGENMTIYIHGEPEKEADIDEQNK